MYTVSKETRKLPVQLNRKQYENLFERVLIIRRRPRVHNVIKRIHIQRIDIHI